MTVVQSEIQRLVAIMPGIAVKSEEDAKELDALGAQCFGHINTAMDDVAFWLKRFNDALEAHNGEIQDHGEG